jgi:hypothetical protein
MINFNCYFIPLATIKPLFARMTGGWLAVTLAIIMILCAKRILSMKMNKWIPLLLLSIILFGCGKKEIIGTEKFSAQSRTVSAFSAIDVSGYYNVNVTIGNPQSLVVKINGNLLPFITTTVRGKTLTVQSKRGYLLRPQGIPEIDIVVKSLEKIALSGNNHLTLMNYRGNELRIDFSGANQFVGQGTVSALYLKASGNTDIDARRLFANKVDIDVNGNSKILVSAKDQLLIAISGNGVINYLGNPKISQTINGSGTITKMQETISK